MFKIDLYEKLQYNFLKTVLKNSIKFRRRYFFFFRSETYFKIRIVYSNKEIPSRQIIFRKITIYFPENSHEKFNFLQEKIITSFFSEIRPILNYVSSTKLQFIFLKRILQSSIYFRK